MGSRFALTLTRVGPATAVGSTQSVAPKLRAAVNFFGLVSIAILRVGVDCDDAGRATQPRRLGRGHV